MRRVKSCPSVYVLSKQGRPLMPCTPRTTRRLLESGRARVVRNDQTIFVIQLTFQSDRYVQPLTAGMDTGSETLGVAVVTGGQVLYQSEIELRSDIRSKMAQKKSYKRTRRARKTRYRAPRFNNRGKKGKFKPHSSQ